MPQIYLKDAIYHDVAERIDNHRKSEIIDKIEEVVRAWLLEQTGETK